MIKKVTVGIATAACVGLVVMFAPGFALEIAADAISVSEMQLGAKQSGLVISQTNAACQHEPWPYGCNWRPSIERKQIAKRNRTRHPRYAVLNPAHAQLMTGSPQVYGGRVDVGAESRDPNLHPTAAVVTRAAPASTKQTHW